MSDQDQDTAPPVSDIYQIRNRHTGRVYIGKSKHVRSRWMSHQSALNQGLHINDSLQGEWDIYGSGALEFTILENVSGDRALREAEARHVGMASNAYNIASIPEPKAAPASNGARRWAMAWQEVAATLLEGEPGAPPTVRTWVVCHACSHKFVGRGLGGGPAVQCFRCPSCDHYRIAKQLCQWRRNELQPRLLDSTGGADV